MHDNATRRADNITTTAIVRERTILLRRKIPPPDRLKFVIAAENQ